VVADDIVGFCVDELNPFTPDQEKVPPETFAVLNIKLLPTQIGVLLVIVGAFGIASIDKYVTSKKKINEMTENEEEVTEG
jgi:high-affinity K+ transport system ATPase subunit B